ncbi:DNA/RNA helicase domain-containing protein [Neobacillus sp. 179-C4.2 HS]|uniref:DNA/RNA helicase domain-containing protein n=1 Tax=Neobacillus driksii TaxID=3035913 RepID=A0ABV4YRM3_9BACI
MTPLSSECSNQIGCIHTVQGLEMDYVGAHYRKRPWL